jgi:hypothetical protein
MVQKEGKCSQEDMRSEKTSHRLDDVSYVERKLKNGRERTGNSKQGARL